MRIFCFKNYSHKFVYKNLEERESFAPQIETREKSEPNLEAEEKNEREALEKEYEETKTRIDVTKENLDRVEGVIDQVPKEFNAFDTFREAKTMLDSTLNKFNSISLEDVEEFTEEAKKKIDELNEQFDEFRRTLESSDPVLNDAYYNSTASDNKSRERHGEKPLLDKLFTLEKDAKKILKILDLFKKCDYGDLRMLEFSLEKRPADEIISNFENLLKNRKRLSAREFHALIYHFSTDNSFMLDDQNINAFIKNKKEIEKLSKEKGLKKDGFDEGYVLYFLDEDPFLPPEETVNFIYKLKNHPTQKLELHHIKELRDHCGDVEKVIPIVNLLDDGLGIYEIAKVTELEGSGQSLYEYFHKALISGFFGKTPSDKFKNILSWYKKGNSDISKILDILVKLQDIPLTDQQITDVYSEAKTNDKILDLIHLAKDGFQYDIVLELSRSKHESGILLECIDNLRGAGFSATDTTGILRTFISEDDLAMKESVKYFTALKSSGLVDSTLEIDSWHKIESNYEKVLIFLRGVKRLGLISPPSKIFKVQPSIEKLEANIDFIKSVQDPDIFIEQVDRVVETTDPKQQKRHDRRIETMKINRVKFTEIEAICIAKTFEDKKTTDKRYYYHLEKNLYITTQAATILWVLTENRIPEKSDVNLCKKDGEYKNSLFHSSVDTAFNYVKGLKSHGITDPQLILGLWRCSETPKYAAEIYFFIKGNGFKVFDDPENLLSTEKMSALPSIWVKCKDNPVRTILVKHISEGTDLFNSSNLRSFLSDPSLPACETVYSKMTEKNPELALKVGRTIYFSGINIEEITPNMINEYIKYIDNLKESYADMPIFKDRNVLFIANNENWDDGSPRFATEDIIDGIEASDPKKFDTLSPGPNSSAKDLNAFKEQVLRSIRNSPPPLTVVFAGHGGPRELYHYDGQIRGEVPDNSNAVYYITSDEIADAMIKRAEKFGKEAIKTDFYTFHSCFSSNFIRDVIRKVQSSEEGQLPLLAAEAEYGQYSFSKGHRNEDSEHLVLGIPHSKTSNVFSSIFGPTQTIGRIIDNENKNKSSNFTLIIPADKGHPAQIVKNDERKHVDNDTSRETV